ncbi:ABC transporter ATP-binding protein [Comamonadaceae bacterium OH3737_COT-264]|nr:ABC transporter ATP-binding protein [Comamonadaceae bacterium OH3737_COT-264]
MLRVEDLHAWYGPSPVLRGVHLHVQRGEILALLGRNGSGRSTLARALMGLTACRGRIRWQASADAPEMDLTGLPPHTIARLGMGYVPEHRDIFPRLSVLQNLLLGQQRRATRTAAPERPPWGLADAYCLFPRLRERQHMPAGVLSGGEQQMLALCRTMMGEPALVLIDEPTEGLAPMLVTQVAQFLQTLRARGVAVLLIEQKLAIALEVADRCLVMGHGRIVFEGSPAQLRADAAVRQQWLQV